MDNEKQYTYGVFQEEFYDGIVSYVTFTHNELYSDEEWMSI